jgi:hypothetical protein
LRPLDGCFQDCRDNRRALWALRKRQLEPAKSGLENIDRMFIDRLLWLRPRVNGAGQEFNAIPMELVFDGLAEVGAHPFRNPELDICCAFD